MNRAEHRDFIAGIIGHEKQVAVRLAQQVRSLLLEVNGSCAQSAWDIYNAASAEQANEPRDKS